MGTSVSLMPTSPVHQLLLAAIDLAIRLDSDPAEKTIVRAVVDLASLSKRR
jgi:hypothetical protein